MYAKNTTHLCKVFRPACLNQEPASQKQRFVWRTRQRLRAVCHRVLYVRNNGPLIHYHDAILGLVFSVAASWLYNTIKMCTKFV